MTMQLSYYIAILKSQRNDDADSLPEISGTLGTVTSHFAFWT
jgi:hypothetical protein